jgi:PIN domain nuclease of toxin-antitoxin system
VLIDTHVFLWLESGSPKLAIDIRERIIRFDGRVFVSAASFWEIAIKRRTGKLVLSGSPRAAAKAAGFAELPIDAADAELAGSLDWEHRDPFDRMLAAQSLNRGLPLVTADEAFRARCDIGIVWAGAAGSRQGGT